MLSTITTAEILFRHESESRAREHLLLASIRDRRAAEAARGYIVAEAPTEPRRPGARAPRAGWPRPIGVTHSAATACAAA